MSTDDVRVILERSADRLERNWACGGQTVFEPPEDPDSLCNLRWTRPLCLMDTIAREVTALASDQTAEEGPEEFLLARSRLTLAVREKAFAALLAVIDEDMTENWDSYLEHIPHLIDLSGPGNDCELISQEFALRHIRRGPLDQRVWTYNDTYCKGGESAARS